MKSLDKLTFGFTDAENYKRRENKNLFSQIFLRTEAMQSLLSPSTFFLVGEKGTGKTAYAVYLSSFASETHKYTHKFIRETDYTKFIALKDQKTLGLSEYTDIWKVIIYLLMSGSIMESEKTGGLFGTKQEFTNLKNVIQDYYEGAFSPEVVSGLQLVENAEDVVKLLVKYGGLSAEASAKDSTTSTRTLQRFQTDLLKIQKGFETALSALSLNSSYTLFIDGIDIRPESVPFGQYLDCVKGLANALWSVNNDFFSQVRDSKGRMKVVALLRPDIFNSLGMQNRNTKLKDNSVVLDWRTRYSHHRQSDLFKMADRLLAVQQDAPVKVGESWDYYFPFQASSDKRDDEISSFITVLRYSFHRPRDILSVFDTLESLYVRTGEAKNYFTDKHLTSNEFRRAYSVYMLGEIKDSLSFYYDEREYELFLKFFEYLDGAHRFDYHKFLAAFVEFMKFVSERSIKVPDFMGSADEFLQFLYDQNILSYIEETDGGRFIRWCFIERSPSNISPKVKTHSNYELHYGLANALNTGKTIKNRRKSATAVISTSRAGFFEGNIKFFNNAKSFGFIVQDGMPVDMFFHGSSIVGKVKRDKGTRVRFRLEKDKNGRLMAVDVMSITGG